MRRHDLSDREKQTFIDDAIQGKSPKLATLQTLPSYNEKYTFTGETTVKDGTTLHQIQALKALGSIPQGLVGGWIGSEANLCTLSPAWVFADSFVYEKAHVSGLSRIYTGSVVRGQATVSEKASLHGQCLIEGSARVFKNASLMDVHFTQGEWTGKHFGNRA